MHPILKNDLRLLSKHLESVRAFATKILEGLDHRPVAQIPAEANATATPDPPAEGLGLEGALAEFAERWEPGFSGSAGPRYLGFVTGGATPAAIAGDWLTATLDQNAATGGDSSAADLERETVDRLRGMLGLGVDWSGSFVSGATMSNFTGLAIGREWLGEQLGISVSDEGAGALGPVTILSGAPHSSIYKAMSMLGIGRNQMRLVPTADGREALAVQDLEEALRALEQRPAIVVANAGTVNTVDFDDLRAIAALKRRYPFWLHVDAAFGAFAALSPRHAHLVDGLDEADSVCVDLHKWLNVPYDSGVQFTRRRELQVRVFQNSAAYLGESGGDPDFINLTPENSRRLRALAAWFALCAYGTEGHRAIVEGNVASARRLGDLLATDPGFRLLAPVRLNVVCFAPAGRANKDRVDAVARRLAESGAGFVTPTVYDGVPGLRAAFSNWRTTEADVDRVYAALSSIPRSLH